MAGETMALVVPRNVDTYEQDYRGGYDKQYPSLDLVRLEHWYFKNALGRVLDYGCGTGTNMLHLLQRGYEVTAIDAAEEAVRLVRAKLNRRPDLAPRAAVQVLDRAAQALPFVDGAFDYVICFSVLSLLETRERIERLLAEFFRVLNPGGRMIIDINAPESDFASKGRFVAPDTFEYFLLAGQTEPLRCYCPETRESFAALLGDFVVEDLGYVGFEYCGRSGYEYLACVRKPEGARRA